MNFESINAIEFIKYGVIGLGFLLAVLSYMLLVKEQKNEHPRKSMLYSIGVFMAFSLMICSIGLISELIKRNGVPSIVEVTKAESQVVNCNSIEDVLLDYDKRIFFVYANQNLSWGFRIFGDFEEFTNIDIVFAENALTEDNLNELKTVFYPLINFSEASEITNEIRQDQLGVRTKNGYLKFADKLKLKRLIEEVLSKSFVNLSKPNDSLVLCSEIYNNDRHPILPEWPWPYAWKSWRP